MPHVLAEMLAEKHDPSPDGLFRASLLTVSGFALLMVVMGLFPPVAGAATPPKPVLPGRPGLSAFAACVADPTTLCLNSQRFRVEVRWKDFQGNTGSGQAISLTGDTGYFWFFSSSNIELVVKVVDGRALNSHFWVFFGALSNVEYTMTVTDSATGSVKTYVNPSGTFGSVGDTDAFLSGGPATVARAYTDDRNGQGSPASAASRDLALRESVLPAGAALPARKLEASRRPGSTTAATDTGTCVPSDTSLCLNNGRFRVAVAWTDFAGHSGAGTAVGLTGDTGYFWFFSSNNVELTVKALDARTLNGRFWVFYGALSNVQYDMTVTDTLTGVVNTYSNPASRFASVGDTNGFLSGYSVGAHLDESLAVSAVIPHSGGSLSVKGADGSVFTLTLPDGALLSDEEITMTPVTSVDRLPLSGGLVSAVQLGPEGLRFFEPVTLIISPPGVVSVDEETTFAWRGTGEEFILFPPDPTAQSAVTLSIFRLSGYGVGRGSSGDRAAQQARSPQSVDDNLDQDLQAPAAEERKFLRMGGALGKSLATRPFRPSGKTVDQILATNVLTFYFLHVLSPLQPLACTDDWKGFLLELAAFKEKVLRLTGPDATLLGGWQAYYDSVYKLLSDCYDKAYDKCKANNDPLQGQEMARLYFAILRKMGTVPRVDGGKIAKCLTFELRFDSFIEEPPFPQNNPGATLLIRHTVSSVIPGISFSNTLGPNEGKNLVAELKYQPDFEYHPGTSKCDITISGDPSVFTLAQLTLDINLFEDTGIKSVPLSLDYDPGNPNMTLVISCNGATSVSNTDTRWRQFYGLNHGYEFKSPNFTARDWKISLQGGIYATKNYNTALLGSESTDFVLKHTPQ